MFRTRFSIYTEKIITHRVKFLLQKVEGDFTYIRSWGTTRPFRLNACPLIRERINVCVNSHQIKVGDVL